MLLCREFALKRAIIKPLFLIWIMFVAAISLAGSIGFSPAFLNHIAQQFGQEAKGRILDWQALIQEHEVNSDLQTIEKVNDFFNRITFISDDEHWGDADYWATPVEMLSTNGGDCEDFSIAKYFTLRELGVPDEKLRITYVKAVELNQAHMVLAYYEHPDSEPLILDNLIASVKSASQRPDLIPVYSFNGNYLWMSKERGRGVLGGSQRINLWRDLNIRIQQERSFGREEKSSEQQRSGS